MRPLRHSPRPQKTKSRLAFTVWLRQYTAAVRRRIHAQNASEIMKVRIGNIEISDISLEELDEIVTRYGGATGENISEVRIQSPQKTHGLPPGTKHADLVLLTKIVDAGSSGVAAQEVGEILQRQGKALPSAVEAWARRVGLMDGTIVPYEYCRVGTRKHIRIKAALIDVAKRMAAQAK